MKITVRVLGRYKDLTGAEHIALDVGQDRTLRAVVNTFVQQYSAAAKDTKNMIVLKNKKYSSFDTSFTTNDEITLVPPVVSGG
ncbi:MAG: MoaD/ThiS family protein [Candidatus Thermoplasmatota archaeon]|nr:MoaD/ThiS family protein [Candidatus Thermoplasmatota archaeon]